MKSFVRWVSQSVAQFYWSLSVRSHVQTHTYTHSSHLKWLGFFSVLFLLNSRFISPLMLLLHSIYVSHRAHLHTCTRASHFFSPSLLSAFVDFKIHTWNSSNHAVVFYFRVNRCSFIQMKGSHTKKCPKSAVTRQWQNEIEPHTNTWKRVCFLGWSSFERQRFNRSLCFWPYQHTATLKHMAWHLTAFNWSLQCSSIKSQCSTCFGSLRRLQREFPVN